MDVRSAAFFILFFQNTCGILCPTECICYRNRASCINKNLTFIPKFPSQIESINFTLNILPNISNMTFLNITDLKLQTLYLVKCAITYIEKESFSVLKYLHYLDISGNQLDHDSLKDGLSGLQNTKLSHLQARNLNLSYTTGLFLSLFNSHINTIDLSNNYIHFLNGSDFRGLHSLKSLNFYENKVSSLDFQGLHNISYLKLRFNRLNEVLNFCPGGASSKLEFLDISGNHIYSFNSSYFIGKCFPLLKTLLIGENSANFLPNNIISDLPSLSTFNVEWMSSNSLRFSKYTFNSTSLNKLYLSNHINGFFLHHDYNHIFRLCPNLQTLVMTSIKLGVGADNGKALLAMLKHLKQLEKLILQSTDIWIVPAQLLRKMTYLKEINLSYNRISNWDNDFFTYSKMLKIIRLVSNRISLVNETSFPSYILDHLKVLDLRYNQFSCTCDLLWFKHYLENHNTTFIIGYPNFLTCNSPLDMQGLPFTEFNLSYFKCINILQLTLVAVGFGLVVLITVLLTVYRFRWHLKYYIYLMRTRKGYQKLEGKNQHFEYDAFVAYNYKDRIWVISQLIVFLEKRNGYKLCLHDRDFVVGKLIVDNICDENKKSRKTILVLTNNFAESHWCQFELTLAQARHLKENKNHLIVVLVGNIKGKYLTNDIKLLLSSTVFIEWHQNDKNNQMFWDRLIKAMND